MTWDREIRMEEEVICEWCENLIDMDKDNVTNHLGELFHTDCYNALVRENLIVREWEIDHIN